MRRGSIDRGGTLGQAGAMRLLVFDSGVGGVGVAREIRAVMPQAAITYLMDNAGFPYGGLDDVAVVRRVLRVVGAGVAHVQPDLVVVACNTASTSALAALRDRFSQPFVGCVPPVKWAASVSVSRTIGVLATPATVRGSYLHDLGARFAPDCRVLTYGAAFLARLAEDRFAGRAVDVACLRREVAGLTAQPGGEAIDAVALGCTHYGGLLPELRMSMPACVRWLDPAPAVARQVARLAENLVVAGGEPDLDGLVLQTGAGGFQAELAGWGSARLSRGETVQIA